MKKIIAFDMDGTIADLYAVENWLDKLNNEDASPYGEAQPMWDMQALREVLLVLIEKGWEVRIITWLAKDSSEWYKDEVREQKKDWLDYYNFPYEKCHMVAYGTTKANCIRHMAESAILIDDNAKVRDGWTLGETLDPTNCDLIAELWKLVENPPPEKPTEPKGSVGGAMVRAMIEAYQRG